MKKIQLLLTNPCNLQWDQLKPDGNGRFCDNCEKHIIDLTAKSDAELIQFFQKKKDNVCGHVLASQLNRELIVPPSKLNWQRLLPLAIGAMFTSPAQALESKPSIAINNQDIVPAETPVEAENQKPVKPITLSGKVVDDQTGKPLQGVKVRQKGFENVLALTDSTGKFELELTAGTAIARFTFELNGYAKIESELTNGMVIKLSSERVVRLGGISTVSLHHEPLYLVYAGKKSCTVNAAKMKEINPNWIEKIDILKDAKATAIYGAKAANGVILIGIKKEYRKKVDFSQGN